MSDLPTIPANTHPVEFTDNHTTRTCDHCQDDADFGVFVGNPESDYGLVVNAILCREHFADAPRVKTVGEHPKVNGNDVR